MVLETGATLLLVVSLFGIPSDEEIGWTQFRGPNGSGVSDATDLPEKLGPKDHVAWRAEVPPGFSSPVVSEEHVFVTAHDGTRLLTICIDRWKGDVVWEKQAPQPLPAPSHGPNSPVSCSPVTDGSNVYAFFDAFGLVSYDKEGTERWRQPLDPIGNPYGMGSSPVIAGNRLLFLADGDTGSALLAFDTDTGKQAWKVDRPGSTHSFSSPVIYRPKEGPAEVIVSGAFQLVSYSLEKREKLWWVEGLAWQVKPVPIVHENRLFVLAYTVAPSELGLKKVSQPWGRVVEENDKNGDGLISKEETPEKDLLTYWFLYDVDKDGNLGESDWNIALARNTARNGLFAFKLGGRGDVSESHELWHFRRTAGDIPSPVIYDGVLYVLKEGGILTSLDPDSGEMHRSERIRTEDADAMDSYYASLVAADGKLFAASHPGKVSVIRAGKEWEVLSIGDLGEEIWATPAIDESQVFVRTQKALYCFENS